MTLTPEAATVDETAEGGDAWTPPPSDLLLWLWGRAPGVTSIGLRP